MGKKKNHKKRSTTTPSFSCSPAPFVPLPLPPSLGGVRTEGPCARDEPPVFFFAPLQWMRARWTSDPCYAFFGVDGTECSFLIYLSEVEWFCPPLPWRNQTAAAPSPPPPPRAQVKLGTPGGM